MQKTSKIVESSQAGVHPRLFELLDKYVKTEWRQPIRDHNKLAFEAILPAIENAKNTGSELILDSGCGTGWSTVKLAKANPQALVLGIDRSEDRLCRNDKADMPSNGQLLRADCEDIWRLLAQHNIQIDRHYFYYPNPYPKIGDVQKRWYGHPVFLTALGLSKTIECRSNWQQYIADFAAALEYLKTTGNQLTFETQITPVEGAETNAVSPFEKKYAASGQPLYKLTAKRIQK